MAKYDNLAFFEERKDLDPVSFFRWKRYETQEDKKVAHSAYVSLMHTATSLPEWREHGEVMEGHWQRCRKDSSLADFWAALPLNTHSQPSIIRRLQTKQLVVNVKRLHRRDNELSQTLDAGLLSAAKQSAGTEGSSTTPPGSPPPHTSTDSTDIVAASSTLSSRDVQVASGDGLLLGSDSIASSRTATMSPLTSASCGKLTKATDNATTKFGTTLKSAEHRRLILRPRKPSSSKAHPLTSETSSSASPVSLSVPAVTSSSMVSSPSSAPSISTSSASRSMSLTSAPAHVEPSNTSAESEQLLDREREELLRSVDESSHPCCDWKIDDVCIACIFAEYQRSCIEALSAREIKKTDIADIMAIIGVFAPSMPTSRMHEFFSAQQLKIILGPGAELPDIDVDDAKIQKAVRLYLNNKGDEAEVPMTGGNKKIRIMLETLLEYLPMKTDNTVSESTFTVKYVAPIIQAYVDSDRVTSDFPNTDSVTQKHQNLKADRPDIRGKAFGQEVLWGEVTGPTQAGNNAKNLWDTYKLARFGKASIIAGKESAPLVQVIDDHGTYMRLYLKVRGVMILEELGEFVIPTRKSLVPALVATLPTLELLKEHLKEASHEKVSELKRSWGHQDVKGAKKRLI